MVSDRLASPQITVLNVVNLSAVITDTDGDAVDMGLFIDKTVFINVPVNTGAVTVNIEASPDGTTWFNLRSETYTSEVTNDVFSYFSHFRYMRTTTTTQSNSTVTTNITGRS